MRRQFIDLIKRFHRDERGVFLVIFGVMAVVIIAMAGAVVDFVSIEQARARAQVALDSAALALQSRIYDDTEEEIRSAAEDLVRERVGTSVLEVDVTSADVDTEAGTLTLTSTMEVATMFVSLVGIDRIDANVVSQVTRGSQDIEVAVALDITGSMSGSKIQALRDATGVLIDLVVQDEQEPTYSKMAIAPYSMGVNVGTHATALRGAAKGATSIIAATYFDTSRTITAATRASPGVITSANHGFVTGDRIYITGVNGMTQLNNIKYRVVRINANTFSLQNFSSGAAINTTSGNGYSAYTSGGTARRCITTACEVQVTSLAHGFVAGDNVYITGVNGMTQINRTTTSGTTSVWPVAVAPANTTANYVSYGAAGNFILSGSDGPAYSTYTNGGSAYCTRSDQRCQWYYFRNQAGTYLRWPISTCVTERVGSNQYTDAAPSTRFLGLNYPSTSNVCIQPQVMPLTTDKDALHDLADDLTDGGSTAGHIGLAWAWYLVSPNFGYIWSDAEERPAAYGEPNLVKAVVLMTDGQFNTAYCNGVIAKDSGSGSGSTAVYERCDATNGSSHSQGLAICNAMKAQGIIVYTVAFDVEGIPAAEQLMAECATDAAHAFVADSATDLVAAFAQIGQNLAALRVTR